MQSLGIVPLTRRAVRPDRRDYGQTRPQPIQLGLPRYQYDFDRNTLNDLCEISGRVIGWQKSELRSASRRNLVDFAMKYDSGKRIDLDLRTVSRAHVTHLRFLVIRLHPNIALHQREDLGPGTDELSCPHFSFADDPIFGRDDPRIT